MPVHPFLAGGHPLALAHRGGALECTENSPEAFQRAARMGFRYVETDVRATRDGVPVVFHDKRLDRTTDRVGEVARCRVRDVLGAHLRNGESPMDLPQALERFPDLRFNVDVKSDDAVGPFLQAVSAARAWDRVCAASFSSARLRRLRHLAGPRLATSMGTAEVVSLVLGLGRIPPACSAQVPRTRALLPVVSARFVRAAHARGLQVHVWTVDDAPTMASLLDLGVDGLVTDRPSVLREVLQRRGQWR